MAASTSASADTTAPGVPIPASAQVIVEVAVPTDVDAIAAIGAATFLQSFGHSMPAEHMAEYLATAYAPAALAAEMADAAHNYFCVARLVAPDPAVSDPAVSNPAVSNPAGHPAPVTHGDPARDAPTHGVPIGFVQIKLGTTEPCLPAGVRLCELHRIYVAAEHAGKGVGRVLMQHALDWAHGWAGRALQEGDEGEAEMRKETENRTAGKSPASASASAMWLGVWEENLGAQRFYQRYGFERVGHHDFVMGDTTQTDWVLIKYLDGQQ